MGQPPALKAGSPRSRHLRPCTTRRPYEPSPTVNAEAAFGFEQVLVAQRDVLGAQVRVGGRQQVLAVQPLLGGDLLAVQDEPAGRQLPQPPAQGRVVTQRALGPHVHVAGGCLLAGLAPLDVPPSGGLDPLELSGQAGERLGAPGGVPFGFVRVVANDPPHPGLALERDFLDPQVVPHLPIPALTRQRRLRPRVAVTHPLTGDPVPTGAAQVVQVRAGGEPAVDDGDDPPEPPTPQVVLDLRQHRDVGGAASGQTQHRTGIPSRVTARPMTICGRSGRLSLECPYRRKPPAGSASLGASSVSRSK
jgi:hypothetical protein